MRLKIGDVHWKIRLLSPEKFCKIHDDNNEAVTDPNIKTMDFRTDCINITNVRHELFHAYFTLTLTGDTNMDKDNVEEVSAALIGKYGQDLINNSVKILTWLEKQLEKRVKK